MYHAHMRSLDPNACYTLTFPTELSCAVDFLCPCHSGFQSSRDSVQKLCVAERRCFNSHRSLIYNKDHSVPWFWRYVLFSSYKLIHFLSNITRKCPMKMLNSKKKSQLSDLVRSNIKYIFLTNFRDCPF